MGFYLAIQVEKPLRGYQPLAPLSRRGRVRGDHSCWVTPLYVTQRRAIVRAAVCYTDERPPREVCALVVEGLSPGERLEVTAGSKNGGEVEVRIASSTGGVQSEVVDLAPYCGGSGQWRRAWVVASILAVLFGGAITLLARSGADGSRRRRVAEMPQELSSLVQRSREVIVELSEGATTARREERGVGVASPGEAQEKESSVERREDGGDGSVVEPVEETVVLEERTLRLYFAPNDTVLSASSRSTLDQLAREITPFEDAYLTVVGHTALFGNEEGRVEISRGRALNVVAYLRSIGWRSRVEPEVRWVGSQEPVTRLRAEQERNRRVVITVAGNAPGIEGEPPAAAVGTTKAP